MVCIMYVHHIRIWSCGFCINQRPRLWHPFVLHLEHPSKQANSKYSCERTARRYVIASIRVLLTAASRFDTKKAAETLAETWEATQKSTAPSPPRQESQTKSLLYTGQQEGFNSYFGAVSPPSISAQRCKQGQGGAPANLSLALPVLKANCLPK